MKIVHVNNNPRVQAVAELAEHLGEKWKRRDKLKAQKKYGITPTPKKSA